MHRRKLRILVVDNQPGVRCLLTTVFEEEGHEVRTASDGLEAVEEVKICRPDLMFMDVRMPNMSGLEALRLIKHISPDTKVVLMTAYVSDETIQKAVQNGALCCMSKPFDIEWLKSFVDDQCRSVENVKTSVSVIC